MASVKFYKNDIAYPKVLADKLNKLADTPDAMEFKGSLGVGGTITALPVDGSAKKGDTYKVITDGTYAGQTAKIGDLFICNEKTSSSNTWVLIPSGDEPSGTVTSVKIEANAPISVNDSTPITSSGTRTISHNTSGVNAGSYGPTADVVGTDNTTIKVPQITVDSYGHITGVAERTYTSKDTDTKVTSADNHYGYASGSGKASGLYKVATDDAGHVTETTAVSKADITALGIPGSDTNTHRPIQVDGTEVLGDNATPLNLSGGTNISLSDNGSGKLTIDANIPKTEHELIYFDPDNISINDGLFTQQLMYEDGIVVDNPTDLSKCKGENDFAFLEIKDTWGTELISDTTADVDDTDYLKPGGIVKASNGFWYYNASANTLDAKFNDNKFSRYAFLYNPDTSTHVFHDALYGFYENNYLNDVIGCGFIGFGTTPETDGWYPTVVLKFNINPIQKEPTSSSHNSIFRACNMDFIVYKRRQNYTPHTYIANNYLTQTPAYSFGIIGQSSSNKVTGSTVENGKCVVLNTELINVPSSWGAPGEGGGTYYGPSYVRVITEKDGDVITWKFSQILSGKITDLEAQKPDIIIGTKVQIDLANYKVRYITSGETSWNVYDVKDPYKKYFDILKNDAHFGFGQSSTPSGRIYNITSSEHRLLLDINTDKVWENINGTWSIYQGKTPLELMTGSRLNYNNITDKLWYSNGSQIYELKTDSGGGGTGSDTDYQVQQSSITTNDEYCLLAKANSGTDNTTVTSTTIYDSSVTINPSTHTITGIDEIKKTNYRIKSGNANNQFNTYGGMVLPYQSWSGEVLMLETRGGGNSGQESAGIIISESEGVQVFAPCDGNPRNIFSVYDEDDLVADNPTPIFAVTDYPEIICRGALDVTSSVTLGNGLYVTGDTYCTGAYYSSSDMRKKDVLEEISLDKAYELVEKCQTIFYTWKDDETKKKEIGLIAQEVQQYFPELVSEDKDGYLTLDYSKLTVILLVVIRDLTQKVSKIDTLEEKIKQLENKIQ